MCQHKSPLVAQPFLAVHAAPFTLAATHDMAVRPSKRRAACTKSGPGSHQSLPAPQHNNRARQSPDWLSSIAAMPLVAQSFLAVHAAPFAFASIHDMAVRTSKPRAAPSLAAPQHNDRPHQHESPLVAQSFLAVHAAPFTLASMHDMAVRTSKPRQPHLWPRPNSTTGPPPARIAFGSTVHSWLCTPRRSRSPGCTISPSVLANHAQPAPRVVRDHTK